MWEPKWWQDLLKTKIPSPQDDDYPFGDEGGYQEREGIAVLLLLQDTLTARRVYFFFSRTVKIIKSNEKMLCAFKMWSSNNNFLSQNFAQFPFFQLGWKCHYIADETKMTETPDVTANHGHLGSVKI